ncbi:MAG: hypothetical protein JO134_01335 [Xanthobacteraceae bacterium]|nr:hypothetical protein [Xanthobacteraceae bacterium]
MTATTRGSKSARNAARDISFDSEGFTLLLHARLALGRPFIATVDYTDGECLDHAALKLKSLTQFLDADRR